jgi:hypothetical protein
MAIFPPCLVFADFPFAAFTVFSIANLLYVIYSAAFRLIITCTVSCFPRYVGASLGASVPVYLSLKYSTIFTTFGRLFPALFFLFISQSYFEVRHLYFLQHILHSVLEFLNNQWG